MGIHNIEDVGDALARIFDGPLPPPLLLPFLRAEETNYRVDESLLFAENGEEVAPETACSPTGNLLPLRTAPPALRDHFAPRANTFNDILSTRRRTACAQGCRFDGLLRGETATLVLARSTTGALPGDGRFFSRRGPIALHSRRAACSPVLDARLLRSGYRHPDSPVVSRDDLLFEPLLTSKPVLERWHRRRMEGDTSHSEAAFRPFSCPSLPASDENSGRTVHFLILYCVRLTFWLFIWTTPCRPVPALARPYRT